MDFPVDFAGWWLVSQSLGGALAKESRTFSKRSWDRPRDIVTSSFQWVFHEFSMVFLNGISWMFMDFQLVFNRFFMDFQWLLHGA